MAEGTALYLFSSFVLLLGNDAPLSRVVQGSLSPKEGEKGQATGTAGETRKRFESGGLLNVRHQLQGALKARFESNLGRGPRVDEVESALRRVRDSPGCQSVPLVERPTRFSPIQPSSPLCLSTRSQHNSK